MKKYLILLLPIFLLGCGMTLQDLYPTPKELVCDKPEAEGSVVCKVCREELNMEPEQLDGILLDTVAIGKVASEIDKAKILLFIYYATIIA